MGLAGSGRHIGKLIGKNVAWVAALFIYEQIKSLPTKKPNRGDVLAEGTLRRVS
jgi:hypothetical protein